MNDLSVNDQLAKENIFELFKQQLQKDFEGAGLDGDFVAGLPADLAIIHTSMVKQLAPVAQKNYNGLMALLYRVDISQQQIKTQQAKDPDQVFEVILSELIIKRVPQKVILKKRFSK